MPKSKNEAMALGIDDVEFNNRVLTALSQIDAANARSLKNHVEQLEMRVARLEEMLNERV